MKGVTLANFRPYVKADAGKADLKKIGDDQIATEPKSQSIAIDSWSTATTSVA